MTGRDREQLAATSEKAKVAMGVGALDVLADRGCFSGGFTAIRPTHARDAAVTASSGPAALGEASAKL